MGSIKEINLEDLSIKSGENVLLLWKTMKEDSDSFDVFIRKVHDIVHPGGGIVVSQGLYSFEPDKNRQSRFDVVLSGILPPYDVHHDFKLLADMGEVCNPGARLYATQKDIPKLESALKLLGVSEKSKVPLSKDLFFYSCQFPAFEMGSSTLTKEVKTPASFSAWNLPDDDLNDMEVMDSEDLLNPEDFKKPQASDLRVCGTTGKKKACKDCSCGLREELDAGGQPGKKDVNSSCGSCYLGDAFRCASCPYSGMPAFKPGEKVSLSDMELKPDN